MRPRIRWSVRPARKETDLQGLGCIQRRTLTPVARRIQPEHLVGLMARADRKVRRIPPPVLAIEAGGGCLASSSPTAPAHAHPCDMVTARRSETLARRCRGSGRAPAR